MCMAGIEWCGMRAVYFGTGLWDLEAMGLHQIDIPAVDVSAKKNFGTKARVYGGVLDPYFPIFPLKEAPHGFHVALPQ